MSTLFMYLFRSMNARLMAQRFLRTIWQELSRLAGASKAPPYTATTVRIVDGISLLAPRLAMAGGDMLEQDNNALGDLCSGLNIARLLRQEQRLARYDIAIRPVLTELNWYFRKKLANIPQAEGLILERIDQIGRAHV